MSMEVKLAVAYVDLWVLTKQENCETVEVDHNALVVRLASRRAVWLTVGPVLCL